MQLEKIDIINEKRWFDFISNNPKAMFFHHPAWVKVLSDQYNFSSFAYCLVNDKNEINAGIPFCRVKSLSAKEKLISLPFSDYCIPLYSDEKYSKILFENLFKKSSANQNYLELKWNIEDERFLKKPVGVIHFLNIPENIDEFHSSLNQMRKRGIKKSKKEGLKIQLSNSIEAMEKFYCLHLKTRKKQGVPIQPKSFFKKIEEEILSKNLGFFISATKDNETIGSALFLSFGHTITYKFGASDPSALQYRPNDLIFWEAISHSINNGYKIFDFGKTDFENEGLRKFKSSWGGEEQNLYYSYYPMLESNGKLSLVKDKIVSPIIKNSPELVCRITGELFYKYFA